MIGSLGTRLLLLVGPTLPLPAPDLVLAFTRAEVTNDAEQGDGFQMTFSLTKLSDVEHLAVDDRTGMSGLDPGAAHPLDAVDEGAL